MTFPQRYAPMMRARIMESGSEIIEMSDAEERYFEVARDASASQFEFGMRRQPAP
jgi:hypothetical protein